MISQILGGVLQAQHREKIYGLIGSKIMCTSTI